MRTISCLDAVLVPLLLSILQDVPEDVQRDIDTLEFMSGEAQISKATTRLGLTSYIYDKSYSHTNINDILTIDGYQRAFDLLVRVKRHGSVWLAPVCSSWVWIGRHRSGRSSSNPAGDTSQRRIRQANSMVARLVVLALLAWFRGCHIFLENPLGTLVHQLSPLRELISSILQFKVSVHLSSFGAKHPKPIVIWSSTEKVKGLKRKKKKTKEKLSIKHPDGSVSGRKHQLKASQAYPREFGEAVSLVFKQLLVEKNTDDLLENNIAPRRPKRR